MFLRVTKPAGLLTAGLLSMLLFCSCLHDPEPMPEPAIDLTPYEQVWEAVEASCPYIARYEIPWMELGTSYYDIAFSSESEAELYQCIADMLSELQDPSVFIRTPDGDSILTCTREYESNVDLTVLMDNYLEPNGYAGSTGGFSWCDPSVLPYACFDSIPSEWDSTALSAFDEFIEQCNQLNLPEMILDIRMNPHGRREMAFYNPVVYRYSQQVFGRFTDRIRSGAVYRARVGLAYDSYYDWHSAIHSMGPTYTGTVYLLTGGGCTHAAEDMAVNLGAFPDVVILGDTTAGSSNFTQPLMFSSEPSGAWLVYTPAGTILTRKSEWVENVGYPPDVYVEATEADFAAGVDPVLEYAMGLLTR